MTNEQQQHEAYYAAYWGQLTEYDLDQMYQEFLAAEGAHTPAPAMPRSVTVVSRSGNSLTLKPVTSASMSLTRVGSGYRIAA